MGEEARGNRDDGRAAKGFSRTAPQPPTNTRVCSCKRGLPAHPVTKGGGRQIPRGEDGSVPPLFPGTRSAPRSPHCGVPRTSPPPPAREWAGGGDSELRTWTLASQFGELQLLALRGVPVLEYPASSESFSRQRPRTPGLWWPAPTPWLPHPGSLRRCWSSARSPRIWDPAGELQARWPGSPWGIPCGFSRPALGI